MYYVRKAQKYFGPTKKSCYAGEFNVTLENNKLYLNIFLRGEKVLTMRQYANPYHVAQGVLGAEDPDRLIEQIKQYQEWGFIAGVDFTVTHNGLRKRIIKI